MKKLLPLLIFALFFQFGFSQKRDKTAPPDLDVLNVLFHDKNGPYGQFSIEQEDLSLRTENSKHFKNSDGTYTALIGAGALHYKENGVWKTILSHILTNNSRDYRDLAFASIHNQHKIYFPLTPGKSVVTTIKGQEYRDWGKPALVWLDANGNVLAEVLPSATQGTALRDSLVYNNMFPGVDAVILNSTTTKKLNYLIANTSALANRPAGAVYLAFRENISTESSWKLKGATNTRGGMTQLYKEMTFADATGGTILEVSRPLYFEHISSGNCTDPDFDSTKNSPDSHLEGDFLVQQISGNTYTTYTLVPVSWLAAAGRKYPVTIDPVTNYYPTGFTWPTHTANRSGNSGNWECFVGTYAGRTYVYDISYGWVDDSWPFSNPYMDGYASFNIDAIPTAATINSATAYWYRYGGRTCDNAITLKFGRVQYNEHLAEQPDCNVDGNRVRSNNGYYNGTSKNATGWHSQSASVSDVTSALVAGQFTMGWAYNGGDDCCTTFCGGDDGDYHHVYGYQHSTLKPYIQIDYCLKPTVTTHPADKSICTSGTMTAMTVVATGTALTYQWQVSRNTACSGATGWTNISGATAASYTPPKIAGTRLYRCVVTSSDCPSGLSGRSVNSNCARATVNIMNGTSNAPVGFPSPAGTGDNPPAIQFSLCGGKALPGSAHIVSTLQPPSIGAVNNISSYAWSASGGTFTGSGSSVTWTAPTTLGFYNLSVTYTSTLSCGTFMSTCTVEVASPPCDFAYVRPSSSGVSSDAPAYGGPDNPYATLAYAVSQLGGRTYIRMSTGTFTETLKVNIPANVVIEGGYDAANGWRKTSDGVTTINFTANTGTGGTVAQYNSDTRHFIGFSSNATSGWTLQDLTITTAAVTGTSTSGNGSSNYAIWINGSSNYSITRCQITSGAASAGLGRNNSTGFDGSSGAQGTVGQTGTGGNCSCGGDGTTGGAPGGTGGGGGANATRIGGSASGGSAGATGGTGKNDSGGGGTAGGGRTGTCSGGGGALGANDGGNDDTPYGGNGSSCTTTGTAGTDGTTVAATYANGYFLPGYGTNGTSGGGGGGGAGGGGGGWDDGGCDAGGGGGSGGSGGGGGGGAGAGARGGGGSFGIFIWGGGTGGNVLNSTVAAGTVGTGGTGGLGGAGGVATGISAQGNGCGDGDANRGGRGGGGAAGGAGGDGGSGPDGIRYAIARQNAGSNPTLTPAAFVTINSSVSGGTAPVTSPVIRVLHDKGKPCINSEINLYKASGTWTIPSGLTFVNDKNEASGSTGTNYTTATQTVKVYTTTASAVYDLTAPLDFPDFLRIDNDNRPLPTITITPSSLCVGAGAEIDLAHTNSFGTQVEYEWRIFSATANDASVTPLLSSNLAAPTVDVSSLAVGSYKIRYRVREICCGWSRPVYGTFAVNPQPSQPNNLTKTSGSNFTQGCEGVTNLSVNAASGSNIGAGTCVYEYSYQNTDDVWSAWQTTIPVITAGAAPGFVRIKARYNCDGVACSESPETPYVEWEIIGQPVAGTVTRTSPVEQFACLGVNLTAAASGGTGGISATDELQWRVGTSGGWTSYSAPVSTTTNGTGEYYFQTRRVSTGPGCTTTAWEPITNGTLLWTVDVLPVAPTITRNPNEASLCVGASLTVNVTQFGSGGAGSCTDMVRYSTDNGTNWSAWSASIPNVTASTTGTYIIQASRICTGGGCDITPNAVSWTVVTDPSAPTATKSPNVATVCAGLTLTLTGVTDNGGGAGTCNLEYSQNGGSWTTTLPSFAATVGTNTIAVRKNCGGSGCDISSSNTYTWTVVADPALSTATFTSTTICPGGSSDITSNLTGGTGTMNSVWQYYNGSSWVSAADGTPTDATYTNLTAATTTVSGIPAPGTYQYRRYLATTSLGCDATGTAGTLTITQPNLSAINASVNPDMVHGDFLWTGLISTNWHTAANWLVLNSGNFTLPATAPDNTKSAFIIDDAVASQCVSASNIATIGATANSNGLYIDNDATLIITGSNVLNVSGNWLSEATSIFTPNTSTVAFKGSTDNTITSNGKKFYNTDIDKNSANKTTLSDNFESLNKTTVTTGTLETPASVTGKSKQVEVKTGAVLNILSNGIFRMEQ